MSYSARYKLLLFDLCAPINTIKNYRENIKVTSFFNRFNILFILPLFSSGTHNCSETIVNQLGYLSLIGSRILDISDKGYFHANSKCFVQQFFWAVTPSERGRILLDDVFLYTLFLYLSFLHVTNKLVLFLCLFYLLFYFPSCNRLFYHYNLLYYVFITLKLISHIQCMLK